ncbi:hypothetical protein CHGG_09785 [Chaetomium globosum CBS 148.51]|uniref:Uncharacterized protein n=1 Tax=Chaetomium globosum (strain ATCC 6205 / CBS 148.51 / DSM 1962 / NBRC 6347 / NRRL 1970) TaxID=306901 RepID=Q2GQG9_CHAGB|nr:uncharacterized protein CHGG_09785 [Chaetomium globosum CBS 148.51]EAQ83381.1 hypothetical protein CHGG_09785 [Chaetomium globosum CBS 148.51]
MPYLAPLSNILCGSEFGEVAAMFALPLGTGLYNDSLTHTMESWASSVNAPFSGSLFLAKRCLRCLGVCATAGLGSVGFCGVGIERSKSKLSDWPSGHPVIGSFQLGSTRSRRSTFVLTSSRALRHLSGASQALAAYGVYHGDMKLDNFHLVGGPASRVMAIDLENAEEVENEQLRWESWIESDARFLLGIYRRHQQALVEDGLVPREAYPNLEELGAPDFSLPNHKKQLERWMEEAMRREWIRRWESEVARVVARDPGRALEPADATARFDASVMNRHRSRDPAWELSKARSTLLVQARTGKIGLRGFLFTRRVPELVTPVCRCGMARETFEHLVLECNGAADKPQPWPDDGAELLEWLGNVEKAAIVVGWVLGLGRLNEFRLAVALENEDNNEEARGGAEAERWVSPFEEMDPRGSGEAAAEPLNFATRREPTPGGSNNNGGNDDGGIPASYAASHPSSLPPPAKSCLKTPGQQQPPTGRVTRSHSRHRRVTFADDDRCLVTGAPFTPHPRNRREEGMSRLMWAVLRKGRSTEALGTPAHGVMSAEKKCQPGLAKAGQESCPRSAEQAEEARQAERRKRLRLAIEKGRERQRQRDKEKPPQKARRQAPFAGQMEVDGYENPRVLRRAVESNRSSFDWCPTGPPHNAAELNRCLTSIVRRR